MIPATVIAALPFVLGPQAGVIDARAVSLDGSVHVLGTEDGLRPVALVFVDTQCPIANKFVPRLNELFDVAADRDVELYGVLSDPTLSLADATKWQREFEVAFPVLWDASGELAARLAPTHVPEAFVIDRADAVRYRGRIDDRFAAIGKLRANIRTHDLHDALAKVAQGEPLDEPRTPPIGCVFEAWAGAATPTELTYTRDIAPLLEANCVECHRAGDVGPFPLDTYESAKRRAKTIALVTRERTMPPWFADPDFAHFRDERRLSPRQIAMLYAWADAGAPEGDEAERLPAPKRTDTRWRLGEPEMVVSMPVDHEVAAEGPDVYRYFVIPSELIEERTIVAVDFRPGDPGVVHHCIAYLDHSGWARARDAEDDAPGFSVFSRSGETRAVNPDVLFEMASITGWAPGTQPYTYPAGTGMRIAAGGDFLLEIHYHLNGKPTTDRSELALYFAKEPVEHLVEELVIGTDRIDIAAGDVDYRRRVWMELPMDVDLLDVFPHMHYLGKRVEAVATRPDGTTLPLIRIPDWDFR